MKKLQLVFNGPHEILERLLVGASRHPGWTYRVRSFLLDNLSFRTKISVKVDVDDKARTG